MIKNALLSFKPAVKAITGDKINISLASIPVLVGSVIYFFAGKWLYSEFTTEGKKLIESHISEGAMGVVVYWIVSIILTILVTFVISYTFVLLVSLIASPFNDLLSARIERKIKGEKPYSMSESLSLISDKFSAVFVNEVKKITLIITLSTLALALNFIPILAPLSIFLNILILSAGFVDYTWSRKNLSSKACSSDLRKNMFGYALGGGFFFLLISIPLINLVVPPLATSYFTIFWIKNNEHSN